MFTHEMIKSFNQLEMDVYNYIISNEEKDGVIDILKKSVGILSKP